jgi:hypothetical protein
MSDSAASIRKCPRHRGRADRAAFLLAIGPIIVLELVLSFFRPPNAKRQTLKNSLKAAYYFGRSETNNAVVRLFMSPKLINGKVWIPVASGFGTGYQQLPDNDPKYEEILLRIDSLRFVELLDWVYHQRTPKKIVRQ